MSFEETMVCDGCSSVLGGGTRRDMLADLIASGGRIVQVVTKRDRHLCYRCVEHAEVFYDGSPIPVARP